MFPPFDGALPPLVQTFLPLVLLQLEQISLNSPEIVRSGHQRYRWRRCSSRRESLRLSVFVICHSLAESTMHGLASFGVCRSTECLPRWWKSASTSAVSMMYVLGGLFVCTDGARTSRRTNRGAVGRQTSVQFPLISVVNRVLVCACGSNQPIPWLMRCRGPQQGDREQV